MVDSSNMDLAACAPYLLRGGETLAGQSFTTILGGKGANRAVAAARLDAGVVMIGCLGDDTYGDQLYRALQAEGIDCQGVEWVTGESGGVTLIVVDDGSQNAIIIITDDSDRLSPTVLAHHKYLLEQAQVMVCQLESPLETAGHVLCWVHALDEMVILNPASATRDVPVDWLSLMDYLVLNETENELLCRLSVDSPESTGCAAGHLHEMDADRVVVTPDAQGALLVSKGRAEHFPVARVKVLDTTVAGDTFVDGLAAVPARGLDETAAIHSGQVVVVISVTRLGAQTSTPSREEVGRALAGGTREGRCRCYRRIALAVLSALRSQTRITPKLTHSFEG